MPIRATPTPPPRAPFAPGAVGGLEPVRQMLERAWRLPAAQGGAKVPAGPGLLRSLGLVGAVAAGALLNSSGGELALLQLQGKVPLDIGLGQWQRAGSAFERWNPQWKLSASATPERIGQAVRRAAELDEQLAGGRIERPQFMREMGRLARTLQGPRWPQARPPASAPHWPGLPPAREPVRQPPGVLAVERLQRALQAHQAAPTARTRETLNDELARTDSLHRQHGARWPAETAALHGALQSRARSALAQPLVSDRAGEVVQQLGRAIRACNARPTDRARREALNDVFALAKRLHANRHEWTPATRRNFDALAPQAMRALYGNAPKAVPAGLPAHRSETPHTRGPGARTGAGAAELEHRARTRQAQALEQARQAVDAGRRTLLPGGSVDALAREEYARRGGAPALGVSEDAFVDQVRRPGPQQGTGSDGRFRASAQDGRPLGSSAGAGAPDALPAPDTRQVSGMLLPVQAQAGVAAPRRESLGNGMTLAIYPPGTMSAGQLRAATAAVIVRNPLAWGGLGTRDAHPEAVPGTLHGELPLREQIDKGHFIAIYGPGSIVPRGTVSVVFDAMGPGVAYAGKLTSSEPGMGARLMKAAARLADAGGQSKLTFGALDPRVARMYETRYGARPIREPLQPDGPPYLFEYDLNDPGVRKPNELPARPHAALRR